MTLILFIHFYASVEILKEEVSIALKERGYINEKIVEWLEYVE